MSSKSDGSRKLPPLAKLLEERKGGQQSIAEQRAVMYNLSATLNQPFERMRRDANGKYYVIN